jgi:hypothetical protein
MPATFLRPFHQEMSSRLSEHKVSLPWSSEPGTYPCLNQINLIYSFVSYFLRTPFYLSSYLLLGFFQVFQIDVTNQFNHILCYVSFFCGDSFFFSGRGLSLPGVSIQ